MNGNIGSELLVFTDLDGTLLDFSTYSCNAALLSLKRMKECGIPLVINSSKTRAEIETMPSLTSLSGAFIVENGSAIFLDECFPLPHGIETERSGRHRVIMLGRPYEDVLGGLRQARIQCRARLKSFSDMSTEEVSRITGLDLESSLRAKEREYSEPFIFEGDEKELDCLVAQLTERGLSCIEGGRLSYAIGSTDKGRAASMVRELYRAAFPDIRWRTVALGDGPNDAAMLRMADVAVVIRRPDGSFLDYEPEPSQQVIISSKPGPAGWNEEVSRLIDELCIG
jgi:mannosyl-3-phosphoglycerate phosphatase